MKQISEICLVVFHFKVVVGVWQRNVNKHKIKPNTMSLSAKTFSMQFSADLTMK